MEKLITLKEECFCGYEVTRGVSSCKFVTWVGEEHPGFSTLEDGSGKITFIEIFENNFTVLIYEIMKTDIFYDGNKKKDVNREVISRKLIAYTWREGRILRYPSIEMEEATLTLRDAFSDLPPVIEISGKNEEIKVLNIFRLSDRSVGVKVSIGGQERLLSFYVK